MSGAARAALTQLGLFGACVNIKMSVCRPVLADKAVRVQRWWLVADFKGAEHMTQDKCSVILGWGHPASAQCHSFCDHTKAVTLRRKWVV